VGAEGVRGEAAVATMRRRAWLVALLAAAPSRAAGAQAPAKAEAVCPWCKNDPQLLAAAGAVSHGPMPMAAQGSAEVARALGGRPWVFLETAHLRWGGNLPPETISLSDRPRVEAELERLRKALPSIPKKITQVDGFLRMHLHAMKGEDFYARFQKVLRVSDADFPEARRAKGPFMGDGRYLGEKEKFEVLLHSDRRTHVLFTRDAMGVTVTDALRWHFKSPHKIAVSVPAEDSDLRFDKNLFPHVAHGLSHAFLCAYKHFSYDPPVWIDEGLAHAMEREINPEMNTFDKEEGAGATRTGGADWSAAAKKLIATGKATSLAELMHRHNFAELTADDHVVAWSKVRFLIDEHGERFAKLLGELKGQLDDKGFPSGRDLTGLTRRVLQEQWTWTPEQFDAAWEAWAKKVP